MGGKEIRATKERLRETNRATRRKDPDTANWVEVVDQGMSQGKNDCPSGEKRKCSGNEKNGVEKKILRQKGADERIFKNEKNS